MSKRVDLRLLSRKFLTVPDNINKEDFMKKGKKILAAFLAVLMVVAIMPFTMFSGLFSSKATAAEGGNKFTFEATSLTAAAAGDRKSVV